MKTINSTPKNCLKNTLGFLLCLVLCGCVTEWEAKDMDEIAGILVVEGFITDDESVITLSRSKGLSFEDNILDLSPYRVTDANVSIECNDGTQWVAAGQNSGEYTVATGKLDTERQYRLKIKVDGHEYQSEFARPMVTPGIDSVFWTKKERGQPVNIHVATHAPDSAAQYYRWSYSEEWELRSELGLDVDECFLCETGLPAGVAFCPGCGTRCRYPFRCCYSAGSNGILTGSAGKTTFGKLTEQITEINTSDRKLSVLYRIDVSQHAISKRAYDYYANVKKNTQQTGSLFAHIPSELKGNITCITDPARTVIGYVDISSSAPRKNLYIYRYQVYEDSITQGSECKPVFYAELSAVPPHHVPYPGAPPGHYVLNYHYYAAIHCVDCQVAGGKSIRELPDDWPDQYRIEPWD